MAKKGDKAEKSEKSGKGAKNGAISASTSHDGGRPAAVTPGPPAPASEPLAGGEATRSAVPAATTVPAPPSTPAPSLTATTAPAPSAPATTAPATSARPRSTVTATPSTTPARGGTVTDEITQALLLPVQVAQRVLPTRRAPVYLGAAALAVVGVIEWPVALGAGLAWEALRRWGPDRSARRT